MTRVLVVDDDDDIRHLLALVLGLDGFDVVVASGGLAGLDILRNQSIDVVVLDVQMPETDGWTTLEAIRNDPHIGGIPVLLCTVKSSAADLRRGWALGCDGYLTKPFDNDDLASALHTVIARSAAERFAARDAAVAEAEHLLRLEA